MSDIPWRKPGKPFYNIPQNVGTKPPQWTKEEIEEWRNNLRRMGIIVDENTTPYTGKE